LQEVLFDLAEQMKKDHELVSRVKGAMTYPIVILIAMVAVGIVMMVLVVPRLSAVFNDLGVELPPTIQFIINMGDFLQKNLILFLLSVAIIIVSIRFFSRTTTGQKFFHAIWLRFPIFGEIIKKINSARFAATLSSLTDSGVSIVKAMEITAGTLGNVYYKEALIRASKEVQKGHPLSKALVPFENIYPPMVLQMIGVGEQTGSLSDVLKNLASFYEEEINNVTKNLAAVIEPVIMIIVGIAVGFFAVSMLQPMYSMMQGIK
jgi:type IV pilus assembly protein PilC